MSAPRFAIVGALLLVYGLFVETLVEIIIVGTILSIVPFLIRKKSIF